jgi:hypothetical protein
VVTKVHYAGKYNDILAGGTKIQRGVLEALDIKLPDQA